MWPLVYLNAYNYPLVLDYLGEELPVVCLLIQGLVEADDAPDAAGEGVHREEQVAEVATVLLTVLNVDLLKAISHGALQVKHRTIIIQVTSEFTQKRTSCPIPGVASFLPVDSSAARIPFPGATIL